jgi:hypothetical protein
VWRKRRKAKRDEPRGVDWGLAGFTGFGWGKVHEMTAEQLLDRLPDEFVNLIILDPPANYGLSTSEDEDLSVLEDQTKAFTEIAEQCRRVLRPGGGTLFMGEARPTTAWELAVARTGLRAAGEMAVMWKAAGVSFRHPSTYPSYYTNVRWHVRPGHRMPMDDALTLLDSNVIVCTPVHPIDRVHPAQRPIELYNYFISTLTRHDDMVVDPFCGSGSALLAAAMCHRSWVGSDVLGDVERQVDARFDNLHEEEMHMGKLWWWVGGEYKEVM